MNATALLKQELTDRPAGVYAPYYYRYLGYRQDYAAPRTAARANAVYSLLTKTVPHIYQNDLIVGSIRPLWCQASEEELEYANRVVSSFGDRGFPENSDHFTPDYRRVVRLGVPGLLKQIDDSAAAHAGDAEALAFLAAMRKTVEGLQEFAAKHARHARSLMGCEGYDSEKLAFIAENCEALVTGAPTNFAQGLQLVWLCHQSFCYEGRYAMALGRIDQYLYDLYTGDLAAGCLTREQATTLLENVFIKLYEHRAWRDMDDVVNICIGGTAPDGGSDVNELSYCVLAAVKNCNIPGPNLSARIGESTPDEFLDECLKVIGTGLGYPALMNDTVNMAALRRYGYAEKDVCDYTMVGCIENFMTGQQPPWSDGRFDTPRFFEYLFNHGKGILHPSVGIDTGDVSEISDMAGFMQRLETQLCHGVAEYVMFFHNYNNRYNPSEYEQPYLSVFCQDCIGRAKDICRGGALYSSVHGAALMGVGTMCDSLAAVEQVVFVDKAATLTQLRQALLDDFVGHEALQKKLLAAPKYGNDDPFVDKYAPWFVDFLAGEFDRYKTHDGGGIYVAMAANTSNIHAGRTIAATPDGRKAGQPLSDAASPTYGRDVLGPTATVNSVTKADYTRVACGTVVNQKFSPEMFNNENRGKLLTLIKVYFQKGGQEMQINATSRKILKDAMAHPEQYASLVVRVSGFSAFYVTLERAVQEDILQRTQQQ